MCKTRECQGRAAWQVLHAWSFSRRITAQDFAAFARALVENMPCEECRRHATGSRAFRRFLESVEASTTVDERALAVYRFHNNVSLRIDKGDAPGKRVLYLSLENLKAQYDLGACEACGFGLES